MSQRIRGSSVGIVALLVAALAALGFGALGFGARGACAPQAAAPGGVERAASDVAEPAPVALPGELGRKSDRLELQPQASSDEVSAAPPARRSDLCVEVQGFVLLPDGAPAAGEWVEVSLGLHERRTLVIERFVVDGQGSFAGSVALPAGATPEATAMIFGEVRSQRGYASRGTHWTRVGALLEKPYPLELRMRRTLAVSGQLVDPLGEPVWPASIYLFEARAYGDLEGSPRNRSTLSNRPDGRFTTTLEGTGEFILQILTNFGGACHPFEIRTPDEHVELGQIVVEQGEAQLHGVLVAAHGAPLPGVRLRASFAAGLRGSSERLWGRRLPTSDCGRGLARASVLTDGEGRFRMRGLVAGEFELLQQGLGLFIQPDALLGQPSGTFATGVEQRVVLPSFPFEVLVQDRDGAGIPSIEVKVTGPEEASAEPRTLTLTTDAEGLLFVPWPDPGPVLVQVDGGHGELLDTPFVVPVAGQTSLPRCTVATDAAPGRGVISVLVLAEPDVVLPAVRVHVRRQGSGELLQLHPLPGGPAHSLEGLAAGTYTVTLRHEPWAGPHFVLPAEDLVRIVELADGGLEHVHFRFRAGGRIRVHLEGDRREAGVHRWDLQRPGADGTGTRVDTHRHVDEGTSMSRYLDFEHWWTLDPVLEPGPFDLDLMRDGERFASRRFHIHPGELQDWVIPVTR